MKDGETKQTEIDKFVTGQSYVSTHADGIKWEKNSPNGGKLRDLLLEDQRNLYITSEGDLQSSVYFHLRNYLTKSNKIARRWFIQNKLYTKTKRKESLYPDIVISRMRENGLLRPYMAIELKETRNFKFDVAKKEINKLTKLLKRKNSFQKGVLIYACLDEILVNKKNDDGFTLWDQLVGSRTQIYTDPKTMKEYGLAWNDPHVEVVLINVFAEKWYPKEIEIFKRRDKLLRKYKEVKKTTRKKSKS